MKLAIFQANPTVGAIRHNTEKLLSKAHEAHARGAAVLIAPELFLTGYPPEDLLYRPQFLCDVEIVLTQLKAESPLPIIVGHPLEENGVLYNAASVLGMGQLFSQTKKVHLPNRTVFDEARYFKAGACDALPVVQIGDEKVGVLICEDIWHAKPANVLKASGATMLVAINASPFHRDQQVARENTLNARFAENQLPIIYCNQVGGQDELVFDGASMVVDKNGIHSICAPFAEDLQYIALKDQTFLNPPTNLPVISEEQMTYDALVLGLKDYAHKNGFKGCVLGLSGGIDSALTLAIAMDALGKDAVHAVMMPYLYTDQISLDDAAEQAKNLGVDYHVCPIEPVVKGFESALKPALENVAGLTRENLQSRSRGTMLMALSNQFGWLLLATGNKSEMAVGYATLYGDMCGGFAVLKDITKEWVYRLANYRNQKARENNAPDAIPQRVIDRPPTAELAPDQLDSDSLPPYETLDAILELLIEQDLSVTDIIARGFSDGDVKKVAKLVKINEYKRRQAPPGVKISRRAFGKDRRYPITSHYTFDSAW